MCGPCEVGVVREKGDQEHRGKKRPETGSKDIHL